MFFFLFFFLRAVLQSQLTLTRRSFLSLLKFFFFLNPALPRWPRPKVRSERASFPRPLSVSGSPTRFENPREKTKRKRGREREWQSLFFALSTASGRAGAASSPPQRFSHAPLPLPPSSSPQNPPLSPPQTSTSPRASRSRARS